MKIILMRLRITIAMLEIRNRETLQSKVNICKSDVKIGDYADSLTQWCSGAGTHGQGRMQDFSGGGANFKIFWDFGYTCRGAACREQINWLFKNGAISCVLRAIFNHFHGKKSTQKIINKHEFFH